WAAICPTSPSPSTPTQPSAKPPPLPLKWQKARLPTYSHQRKN
ncbi:Dihydrolipoamide dehydrogenase of pyruvate dehydrogenase complex (EC 1.8.1.4), partial [uncultured Gammaproteobacteria bacterium]